jgi:hypothetical protein
MPRVVCPGNLMHALHARLFLTKTVYHSTLNTLATDRGRHVSMRRYHPDGCHSPGRRTSEVIVLHKTIPGVACKSLTAWRRKRKCAKHSGIRALRNSHAQLHLSINTPHE